MIIQHTYLDLFTILLLIFYGPKLKEIKNCRNYNASGTLTYYFISLKRKQFFFSRTPLLRTLAIADTKPFPRGCPQKRESTVLVAANQINAKNQDHN